jgi:hypothetical protein
MTNKKDLTIAVLATFCLTATLFMIVPTRSQSGSYDARTDVNGDGTIDMADISMGIDGFMTNGDPTLNVTIAGHATKLAYNVSRTFDVGESWATEWISIDGYSKFTICIVTSRNSPSNVVTVCAAHFGGEAFVVDLQTNFVYYLVKTYDVPNQRIYVEYGNGAQYQADVSIDVYLIA